MNHMTKGISDRHHFSKRFSSTYPGNGVER
jgi:hypothetical protein